MDLVTKKESGQVKRQMKKKQDKIVLINCNISEPLVPSTCTKIVTEITKYIVCHKLIPCPYEALKYTAQSTENPTAVLSKQTLQNRRLNKKVVEAYNNFETIFKNLEHELQNCAVSEDAVEEVVLLLGATVRSPQEMYRIVLPPLTTNSPGERQEERMLLHLIRYMVLSEDFDEMLSRMMSPTNMYVMLKKKHGNTSEWFMPKDSYNLPRCSKQAVINLTNLGSPQVTGDVVTDGSNPNGMEVEPLSTLLDDLHILPSSPQWFQSKVSFKGFRLPKK